MYLRGRLPTVEARLPLATAARRSAQIMLDNNEPSCILLVAGLCALRHHLFNVHIRTRLLLHSGGGPDYPEPFRILTLCIGMWGS